MHLNLSFSLGTFILVGQAIGARINQLSPPRDMIIVQPGTGTLSAALAQLKGRHGVQSILLKRGDYYDNAVLKDYNQGVIIQGEGGSASGYEYNNVRVFSSKRGLDPASALRIQADNVEVYSITFINEYGKGKDTQAVALTADGENHIYGQCSFRGYQDTLYDKFGTHFFDRCHIEGSVDFIFGGGKSFYQSPHISILKSVSGGKQYITANRDGLFVFESAVFKEVDGAPSQSTFYGRAWGSNPVVVFQNSQPPASLNSAGWSMTPVGGVSHFSSAGFQEYPRSTTTNGHTAPKARTKQEIFGHF